MKKVGLFFFIAYIIGLFVPNIFAGKYASDMLYLKTNFVAIEENHHNQINKTLYYKKIFAVEENHQNQTNKMLFDKKNFAVEENLHFETNNIVGFINNYDNSGDNKSNNIQPNLQKKSTKMQKISSFSTSFATSSESRSYNIELAVSKFSWIVIQPKQSLSFNDIVGKRTLQTGYQMAKVIQDGEYVVGVGGGVCQVSTTLYNAWIMAGLDVLQVRAHSLPTSYCELGLDATVSDYIDLVLQNNTEYPIIVNGTTKDKYLKFDIYGNFDGKKINLQSNLVQKLLPPPPIVEYVDKLPEGEVFEDGDSRYIIKQPAKIGYEVVVIEKVSIGSQLISERVLRKVIYKPQSAKILVEKT